MTMMGVGGDDECLSMIKVMIMKHGGSGDGGFIDEVGDATDDKGETTAAASTFITIP